jgi:hypothetical protein
MTFQCVGSKRRKGKVEGLGEGSDASERRNDNKTTAKNGDENQPDKATKQNNQERRLGWVDTARTCLRVA